MGKTVVKADCHGVYIRGCGYIWRPVYPVGYRHVHEDGTSFYVGQKVSVSHSGGPMASIRGDNVRERWFSHGTYIREGGGHLPSEDQFKPSYKTWTEE